MFAGLISSIQDENTRSQRWNINLARKPEASEDNCNLFMKFGEWRVFFSSSWTAQRYKSQLNLEIIAITSIYTGESGHNLGYIGLRVIVNVPINFRRLIFRRAHSSPEDFGTNAQSCGGCSDVIEVF